MSVKVLRGLVLGACLAALPAPLLAQQTAAPADYGDMQADRLVIHNQSATLQVLPAGPQAWTQIATTVKQFLPALNVNAIELFVRDTTETGRDQPGYCYSTLAGQVTSKDQWALGPNGNLLWYQYMVLPANNLNNGQFSYSGNVSKGLAYVLDSGSLIRLLENCANPVTLARPPAPHSETAALWQPAPLLVVSAREAYALPSPSQPDYELPGGRFYTQANGQAGAGGSGFSVVDDGAATMWTEFGRLGGIDILGYPISQRYLGPDGFVYQAFQKAILQWDAAGQTANFANIFDQLQAVGRDPWLAAFKQTPPGRDWSIDRDQPWGRVMGNHLSLLELNPAIKRAYLANPNFLEQYGLPMGYQDYNTVAVLRCQRAVFQQWKVATQFASTSQVLVANGGDNAKDAGLIPAAAGVPIPAPPPASPAPASA